MPTWEKWKEQPVADEEVQRVEGILKDCGLVERAVVAFDVDEHSLLQASVAQQLSIDPKRLGELHVQDAETGAAPKKNSRRTRGANSDPVALNSLRVAHRALVCQVIAPHVAHCWEAIAPNEHLNELVFQAMPSLRIAQPSPTVAIGRRHRDRDYGHQPGQINFWLPLSETLASNTLWVEDFQEGVAGREGKAGEGHPLEGKFGTLNPKAGEGHPLEGKFGTLNPKAGEGHPLEGKFGTAFRFYGNGAYHYTVPNETDITRISIDFRVIPGPLYHDDWEGSRHPDTGRQSFFLGGYYDKAVRDPATGIWSVPAQGGP